MRETRKKCEQCDGTGRDPKAAEALEQSSAGVACLGCGGTGQRAIATDIKPGPNPGHDE